MFARDISIGLCRNKGHRRSGIEDSKTFRMTGSVHVIDVSLKTLGEQDPFTLNSMINLAVTYGNQGHYHKAEHLLTRVITSAAAARSDTNQNMLQAMVNLASVYGNQGSWKQAEGLFAQVVEMRSEVLGDRHADTVAAMDDLIMAYKSQGRLQEADELRLRALGIDEGGLKDEEFAKLVEMIDIG